MRLPEPPPTAPNPKDLADLVKTNNPQVLSLLQEAQREYSSWEDLRYRPMPRGISAEAAWTWLQVTRASQWRPMPLLKDRAGLPFRYFLHEKMLEDIIQVEALARDPFGLVGDGDARVAGAELNAEALTEEAIHSSLLEGAATTRKAAKAMLREGREALTPGEKMVLNNYRTMSLLEEKTGQPLTPELVLEIHRHMTAGTLREARDEGRLQEPGEERIRVESVADGTVVHTPPPAEELPARLGALCEFANADDKMPAVVRASFLHFQLGHDHPFTDGNGRTARALFYWHMLRKGYALFRYVTISKVFMSAPAAYSRAYVHAEQTGDLNYFLIYHLHAVRQAMDDFARVVQQKHKRRRQAEKALTSWGSLNARQRLLLLHALKHPAAVYRATAHMGWHGVTRQTALTDLQGLVQAGLLVQGKSGKELVFRPAADLANRVDKGP